MKENYEAYTVELIDAISGETIRGICTYDGMLNARESYLDPNTQNVSVTYADGSSLDIMKVRVCKLSVYPVKGDE